MTLPGVRPQRKGRIVTFYSYKGGTGRSMAVANVAWILASQGCRVLTIDWDLEAPGLHRYFNPFVTDKELTSSPGIIDFLCGFVEAAHHQTTPQARWFERYTDLEPYTFSLDWDGFPGEGTLDFVSAGQQGPAYAARVTGFAWDAFYKKLGGGVFLEAVKARLRAEYDWILIDSRTGISDTSGICTVQMPDDLVICFTLNNQNIAGAASVAESVIAQRRSPSGEVSLRIWPVPMRVEINEKSKLDVARAFAGRMFAALPAHLEPGERDRCRSRVEVLYWPYYAFEEVLATFGDRHGTTGSVLGSAEALTSYLTDGAVTRLGHISEERRLEVLGRFERHTTMSMPVAGDDMTPIGAVAVPRRRGRTRRVATVTALLGLAAGLALAMLGRVREVGPLPTAAKAPLVSPVPVVVPAPPPPSPSPQPALSPPSVPLLKAKAASPRPRPSAARRPRMIDDDPLGGFEEYRKL